MDHRFLDLRSQARRRQGSRPLAKELAILQLFGARPGEVISREVFLEEVWGMPGSLETRTVDNFISKLRQTLEDRPGNPRHILSIRGAGYRFVP